MGQLAGIFTILPVLISCVGMFGLASFMAERRTKEISIRKVMGASHLQRKYEYRTEISWWIFLVTGIGA
jgi:ABC-type antimicrobial peptide transport system permease subunit